MQQFKTSVELFFILNVWRKAFSCHCECELAATEQPVQPFNNLPLTCQQARSFYVFKTFQKPTSEALLIKAGFTDQTITALYIKLSMFQFKFSHHILYTRDKLFKAKIIDKDGCHACG